MKIPKGKWVFIVSLLLLSVIFATTLYFLKRYLPSDAKDFTSDIVAVLALMTAIGFPLYEKVFPRKLLRKYDVSPLHLTAFNGGDIYMKVRIINSGEVDINVQFQWIDFREERYILTYTKDSKNQHIDSSIVLPPERQKDVNLVFVNSRSSTYSLYVEAYNKKDARLIESFRHIPGKLIWSDVTPSMQKKNTPLGAWIIELLNAELLQWVL
jgi:hypothetical protein